MTTDTILDSTVTSATLAAGATTTGSIDFEGDADWYRITLAASHVYRFTLQGAASANGTLADPLLRLANSAGTQLALNDDSGSTLDSTIEFTAAQGGTYYLSAQAFGSNAGTYLLGATDLSAGPADVAGDATTTSSLAVGASTTGSIDSSLDADWFRITLAAGQQYRFDLRAAPSGQGTLADPLLRLTDSAGAELARNDDAGGSTESSFVYTAVLGGTYYLAAEGYGSNTGTYTLSAALLAAAPGDVAAGTGTLASVAVGGSIGGSIDIAGDTDWFAVTLSAGQQYRFDLKGAASGAGTLGDTTLRVLDGSGTELAFNDDANGSLESSIVFNATASGTYYLAAAAFGSGAGTYTLSAALLSSGPADIPGSSASSAQVVVGGEVTGNLEVAADADWYRVTLQAGHQYRFDLQGQSANGGSLIDPTLRLYDPTGLQQLAFNDDANGTLDSTIAWSVMPGQSGTYFLSAQAYGSGTGTFILRATETTGGAGDVPASTATSAQVSMGSEVTGAIDPAGDQDWYRLTLVQGNHYVFRMQGSFAGLGTLADPLLRLLDASGTEITQNDDSSGNRDSTIDYVATQGGSFLLSAQGFASNAGTFTLSATDLTAGPGDIAQDTGTAGSVPMGGTVAGSIGSPGDQDWFRISLVAGHPYHFDLRGAGAGDGTLADATLRLLDGSGAFVTSDDDSGAGFDSSIAWTATTTGDYYLSTEGYNGYSTGTYVLAAVDDYVDVAAGSDTAAQISAGDTVTGLIDSNGDADWLRITLTAGHRYAFDLQGLDSGGGDLIDPLLRLLDANGNVITLDDDSGIGLDAGLTYTAAQTGDYFLAAQAYSAGSGTYSLRAFDFDALTDILGTSSTGAAIAVGGSVNGTIDSSGDTDWYRIALTAGRQYSFDLLGSPSGAGSLSDPRLRLLDASGTEVAFSDDSNGGYESHIAYTATQSGIFYVSAEAFANARGTYRLDVAQTTEAAAAAVPAAYDAAGGTSLLPEASGAIAVGALVTGMLDTPTDADLVRVALTAGRTYRFDLKGSPSNGTLADPLLRLLDGTGAFITSNDDFGGPDSSITYTATQSGAYLLSAQAFFLAPNFQYTGTYTLFATDTGAADIAADSGTTAVVFMGAAAAGTLETGSDADWYRVTLAANHTYQFDLKGSPSGAGTLADTVLRLLDANGTEISVNDDVVPGSNVESRITYTATTTGTFLLAAQSFNNLYAGTYRLAATDLTGGPVDLPADFSTSGAITAGGSVAGTLDAAGDADWYLVALTAGRSYYFDLRGAPSDSGTLSDPLLRLVDGAGSQVALNDDAGGSTESRINYTPSQGGLYYLSAQAYNNAYAGTYTLAVTDGLPDVAASLGTTASLAIGVGTNGIIGFANDTDWYRVELLAGHQYVFDLRGAPSGTGTLPDAYLQLLDNTGTILAANDDAHGTFDSAIGDITPFEAQQSGVYYLVAAGLNQNTGSYSLEATELGAADMPAVIRTPGRVSSAGGSVTGSIDASGDQDWYRVNLVAGHQYRFDLQGAPSGNGTLADATLRLLSGTGAELAFNDDAGSADSSITHSAASSGTYLLSAQGYRSNSGSFTLRSTDLTGGDIAGSIATGSDIAIGGRASGTLGDQPPGGPDRDWYRVALVNGHTYRFDLHGSGSGAGTLADPYLVLLDSAGAQIDYNDDGAGAFESSITYAATSTADYYLSAQSYADLSTGTYALDVTDLDGGSQPWTGSSFDDAHSGSAYNDVINGDPQAGGNDLIDGKAGDDLIDGGPGNDTLAGGLGNDTVRGGSGDDSFAQSSLESMGDDLLEGGDGNDSFSDWFGDNTLAGGAGDDRFSVYIADNAGLDRVTGGAGRDTYIVLPRSAAVGNLAYVVNDFDVGVGGDMLDVEALLEASTNARFYVPGTSNLTDFLRLQQSGGDTLLQWDRDGGAGAYGWVTLLTLKNIEAAKIDAYNFAGSRDIGSKKPDNLQGASGNDTLLGAGGNDTLNGARGADIMAGGSGADTYYVDDPKDVVQETDNSLTDGALRSGLDLGSAIDTVIASINYTLTNFVENLNLAAGNTGLAGNGNDLDNLMNGNAGANLLSGLGGNDTINGQDGNDSIDGGVGNDTIDGGLGNDSLSGGLGFDTLIGGSGDDTLRGGDQGDSLVGGDGNDFISAGKGLDFLDGGNGDDTLAGLLGSDTMIGGAGNDSADYSGSGDAVTVNLAITIGQFVSATQATDTLIGIENLIGGAFNDNLTGDNGNNRLTGNAGNDTMLGNDGFDTLEGGAGDDSLSGMNQGDVINGGAGNDFLGGGKGLDVLDGGADNDTLQGGLGGDTLTGGNGADTFIFSTALDGTVNVDTITDFVSGVDVIQLSNAIFGGLGAVNATVGLSAKLTYNAGTGALAYDADGAGPGAGLNFAILGVGAHPATPGNDFLIVA